MVVQLQGQRSGTFLVQCKTARLGQDGGLDVTLASTLCRV